MIADVFYSTVVLEHSFLGFLKLSWKDFISTFQHYIKLTLFGNELVDKPISKLQVRNLISPAVEVILSSFRREYKPTLSLCTHTHTHSIRQTTKDSGSQANVSC